MGFAPTHLELKSKLTADAKGQMVGNSFSAVTVARLLVCLVATEDHAAGHDLALQPMEGVASQ